MGATENTSTGDIQQESFKFDVMLRADEHFKQAKEMFKGIQSSIMSGIGYNDPDFVQYMENLDESINKARWYLSFERDKIHLHLLELKANPFMV